MWAKLKDHGKKIAFAVVAVFLIIAACVTTADSVQKTFWALVPPIIAIGLALVTKEVYSSLFIGILSGAMLYSGFSFTGTLNHTFKDGVVSVLSDSYNVGILIFLVILGIMVQLMNRTGRTQMPRTRRSTQRESSPTCLCRSSRSSCSA